jgi:hypothetical protein
VNANVINTSRQQNRRDAGQPVEWVFLRRRDKYHLVIEDAAFAATKRLSEMPFRARTAHRGFGRSFVLAIRF